MRAPSWLYYSDAAHGVRHRRWGSARTWLVVVSVDMPDDGLRPTWIAQARPFCISWGPAESVAEGFANLEPGTPRRIFRGRYRAVGIALYGKESV